MPNNLREGKERPLCHGFKLTFRHLLRPNSYRLLDVLLYNTEIYLDKYKAEKVILDKPLAVYGSKYIPYCTVKHVITFLFYI